MILLMLRIKKRIKRMIIGIIGVGGTVIGVMTGGIAFAIPFVIERSSHWWSNHRIYYSEYYYCHGSSLLGTIKKIK